MKKWLNSIGYAVKGLIFLFKTERNATIEGVVALLVILLSFWLNLSIPEWCLILFCIAGVFSAEAFNTSIEKLADFQYKDPHPEIGHIKDLAAGAVLIMGIVSIVIGIIIFAPKLIHLL